jgi:hypothetical protein
VYVVCCCVVVCYGLVLYGEIDVCVVVWCGVAFLAPAGPAENEDQPSTILCFILFLFFGVFLMSRAGPVAQRRVPRAPALKHEFLPATGGASHWWQSLSLAEAVPLNRPPVPKNSAKHMGLQHIIEKGIRWRSLI